MKDTEVAFMLGALIMGLFLGVVILTMTVWNADVVRGEKIIIGNKSYKCEMVNAL